MPLDGVRGVKAGSPSVANLMAPCRDFFRPHSGIGGRTPDKATNMEIVREPGSESGRGFLP